MRFKFIEENRAMLPTGRLCQIMNVSPRGYRAYRSRPISRSQRKDMVLLAHIREQHGLSLNSYGRPRMSEELKELGLEVGHRRIGRLMRQNGITVIRTRKYKVTTDSNHKFIIAPNLLNRDFTASTSNQKWPLSDARIACQLIGGRYKLCLDARGLALSGRSSGPAFPTCYRLGRVKSNEARSGYPGAKHGSRLAQTSQRLCPSF